MPRVERDPKQPGVYYFRQSEEELEKEDLLLRLEALEGEAKLRNPEFRVPEPPKGLERRKTSRAQ